MMRFSFTASCSFSTSSLSTSAGVRAHCCGAQSGRGPAQQVLVEASYVMLCRLCCACLQMFAACMYNPSTHGKQSKQPPHAAQRQRQQAPAHIAHHAPTAAVSGTQWCPPGPRLGCSFERPGAPAGQCVPCTCAVSPSWSEEHTSEHHRDVKCAMHVLAPAACYNPQVAGCNPNCSCFLVGTCELHVMCSPCFPQRQHAAWAAVLPAQMPGRSH